MRINIVKKGLLRLVFMFFLVVNAKTTIANQASHDGVIGYVYSTDAIAVVNGVTIPA